MQKPAILDATYRFTRDQTSARGFVSQNRASTDALSVLATWELQGEGRSYKELEDTDLMLVAKLSLREEDLERARADMERLCLQYGVSRDVA